MADRIHTARQIPGRSSSGFLYALTFANMVVESDAGLRFWFDTAPRDRIAHVSRLMSEFTPESVRRVAHLARIRVSDAEIARLSRELGEILAYVELLNEVDTADIEPMAHAVELANVFRPDEPCDSLPRKHALAGAPKTDGRYFLVPAILDDA